MFKFLKRNLFVILALFIFFSSMAYATSFTVGVEKSNAKPVALVDEDGVSYSSTNPIPTGAPASTSMLDGRKVVAAAGTAVPLTASATTFSDCDIQAEEDNTGDIVIGNTTVVASLLTRRGILLYPGTAYHSSKPGDLADIYIDSEVNGDGVTFWCRS